MSIKLGTSYEVDYSKLTGKAKQIKAMQDIVEYLGMKRFNKLHKDLVEDAVTTGKPVAIMVFSFAGIQGYPAHAWQEVIAMEAGHKKQSPKVTKDKEPKVLYEVLVSNIGKVWEGNNTYTANAIYAQYVRKSTKDIGRASGESVDMLKNNEIVKSFVGRLHDKEM